MDLSAHALIGILACAVALGPGCTLFGGPGAPSARTAPTPRGPAPAHVAVLVLAYPRLALSTNVVVGSPLPWVDVLDENGEVLARLPPGTWTTLTRPPGRQRFVVVPSSGASPCVAGANASVGVLDADLAPGRYAHVAVFVRRYSVGAILRAMCCSYGESDLWIDLVRVPLLGELRGATLDVLRHDPGVEPLPRGLLFPAFEDVLALARERETARCFDAGASRVDPEHQTSLPL